VLLLRRGLGGGHAVRGATVLLGADRATVLGADRARRAPGVSKRANNAVEREAEAPEVAVARFDHRE